MKLLVLTIALSIPAVEAGTVALYQFETSEPDRPMQRLIDTSGKGHHGRVIGREPFEVTTDGPPFANVTRTALDARGQGDYAIIPHDSDFAPTGDWTIEFFIKPAVFHHEYGGARNIAGNYAHLNSNLSYTIIAKPVSTQPTLCGAAWAFHYQPANGYVVATISYGNDRGETLLAGKDMRDGEWHHIAMVYKTSIENEVSLFVDGHLTTSINQHGGNHPIPFGEGPVHVGAFSGQNNQSTEVDRNFDGFLDEIRFSDAALGPTEFLADLAPRDVQPEIHKAIELNFQTGDNELYRIEWSQDGNAWEELGHVLGDGKEKSFHDRSEGAGRTYRVVPAAQQPNDPNPNPLPFFLHKAAEIRFPTDDDQLYRIVWTSDFYSDAGGEAFVLGDGGKVSYFDRISQADRRFYTVHRY